MKPILATSIKWTALPCDLTDDIQGLLENEHQESMPQCTMIAQGRIYAEEIHLRLGYRPQGQLTQYNFEFASLYSKKEQVNERIRKFLDLGNALIKDHYECDGEMDLPRRWKKLDDDVHMQFSTVNTELEDEADRLLALADDGLIKQELDVQDPLDQAYTIDDPELLKEVSRKFKPKEATKVSH